MINVNNSDSAMKGISDIPERLPLFGDIAELLFFLSLFAILGCVLVLSGKAQLVCHVDVKGDATVQIVVLSNRSIFQYFF